MISQVSRNSKREARHLRIRQNIVGTASKPRLNVFRSNKGIYVQIIDDEAGKTLCSASSLDKEIASGDQSNDRRSKAGQKLPDFPGRNQKSYGEPAATL